MILLILLVLITAELVVMTYSDDAIFWPSALIFLALVALYFFDYAALMTITEIPKHPYWTALFVVLYPCIGSLFSILCWWEKCNAIVGAFLTNKAELSVQYNRYVVDYTSKSGTPVAFATWLQQYHSEYNRPLLSKNKMRIISWITWWPFHVPVFLIRNPLRRFFTAIYNSLSGVYSRISDSVFAKMEL